MVNWSGFVGSFGVVAGVVVLAGTTQGLLGGHGRSVADEVAAVPAVSTPPAASASAYLCSVSCAPVQAPVLSAGEHRARAAYWASQKVTLPRISGSGGGSVSVAVPKQAKQAKASQPKAAKASKQQAAPKAPKQSQPSTTVTVTQKTTTTSKGTTSTSTTTKTTSKG